ncbi:MAG: CYTH domain-containing protein [Candidatus Paceibacterota bacterium]
MADKKQIEIELRAMFDEEKFNSLKDFLDKNAEYLGPDDKYVHFYILSDKLLKVTDNISRNSAKLTLKLNRIGQGSDFEEIEFPIQRNNVKEAVKMFDSLKITNQVMRSFQTRYNYIFKEVELALKYSLVWKYHLELEIIIEDKLQKKEAEKKIHDVAKELGVKIMPEEELLEFVKKVEEENTRNNESVF